MVETGEKVDHDNTCPQCGSNNVRPSWRKGLRDGLLARIALAPFRCRKCRQRFFRFSRRIGNEFELDSPEPVRPVLARLGPAGVSIEASLEPSIEPSLEPARRPSILILDRDLAIRKLLRRVLERQGYRIHEVVNAGDLTTELRVRPMDLLIADLDLSREEAPQVVARLQAAYPDLKIILLSGASSEAFGTVAVLPKPFRTELLLEQVRTLLERAVEPRVAQ